MRDGELNIGHIELPQRIQHHLLFGLQEFFYISFSYLPTLQLALEVLLHLHQLYCTCTPQKADRSRMIKDVTHYSKRMNSHTIFQNIKPPSWLSCMYSDSMHTCSSSDLRFDKMAFITHPFSQKRNPQKKNVFPKLLRCLSLIDVAYRLQHCLPKSYDATTHLDS